MQTVSFRHHYCPHREPEPHDDRTLLHIHHVVMAMVVEAATIDSAVGNTAAAVGMNADATMTAMVAVASDVTAVHRPLRTKAC